MSTLFEEMMGLNDITPDEDEYVTEAVSPENVPELTLFTRKVFLPKGEPNGRGNLICYFSDSIQNTIREIDNAENYVPIGTSYRYYFYNLTYAGTMKNRRYYFRDTKERKEIYEIIKKDTSLYPVQNLTLEAYDKNCYFELSKYFQIYNSIVKDTTPPAVRMNIFWNYLGEILNNTVLSKYKKKLILINAESYMNAFEGKLSVKLSNPIFMLYYTLYRNPSACSAFDHEIVIFYKNKSIKINPSHAEERTTAITFKQLIMRMIPHKAKEIDTGLNNKTIEREEIEENLKDSLSKELQVQQDESEPIDVVNIPSVITNKATEVVPVKKEKDEVKEEIKSEIDKKVETISKAIDDLEKVPYTVKNAIDEDKELLDKIYSSMMSETVPDKKSMASSARDKQIREAQGNIPIGNMTIDKLKKLQTTHMPIPQKNVSKNVKTTNENVKNIKFPNFERTYNEKVFPKDMVNAFLSLNSKSIPLTIIKYDVKDTSDELNYKDTYTVVLEDVNRQRHTISVDIPKFIDDRYMWIGGSKKMIIYQNFLLPVIKCGPDEVQIVTNYNKMFIERFGTKSITSLERLKKLIGSDNSLSEFFKPGYAFKLNADYVTTVEYDELSKQFIKFEAENTVIYFNQQEALEEATKMGIPIGDKEIFIGIKDKKPLFIDQDTQQVGDDKSISDIIIESLPEEYRSKFESIKAPKRLMYTAATTMEQKVSLGLLLGFWEGFTSVLKSLGIKYRLERTIPRQIKSNESYLQFKDCVMVYNETVAQSLIMNGFRLIETKQYTIAEMNTKEPYMDYLIKVYGKRSIANALMNTYEFTIDPITFEILEDMKLPTSLVPLVIYANSLLADSQYTMDYNQHFCRIRTSEILPAILYDCIAKQYINYKNSNGKKKLSLPKDCVIKKLLALNTVEESSTLNPFLELQRKTITMYRGWRGINEDRSYTQDKRVYDKSMIGIIGLTSSPDGSVGVQKPLTMEPNIISARGYLNVEEDYNKLKDVNVFSTLEMLTPLAPERDDPTRVGHAVKQAGHIVPVKKSSPVLISNGAEEVVRFNLSSSFVINADEDGEVVEYNEDLGLVVCRYKSGRCRAISLKPDIVKNGGGGFFLSNQLTTHLKLGDKFKKDDMLAYHKNFFKSDKYLGDKLNVGTLSKVAIMSTYNTYNDSTVITEKMSHDMATEMVFNRQVVIGKNATVDFIADVGDTLEVGDSLIQFDTSYEDNELNKLLDSLSSELKEGVIENSRNNIKSKIAGKIEDIKMYSTVDLKDLSPSLQKIFGKYYKKINERKKLLENYDPESSIVKCGMLFTDTTGKVSPNKYGMVKGQKIEDGVLIEFYVKHEETLEVGSKVSYYTGLKATVGEVIPAGFEPWSEFRKDEEVSTLIASNSVLKRMTPSILLVSLGNKCIVELKRSLYKIFDKKTWGENTKTEMLNLIYKFFTAFDKSGTNTKKYKEMFEGMSESGLKAWFKGFFADEDAYLTLDIVNYEHTIKMEDIERAAKVINIPLFEYVYLPHVTMDKGKVVRSRVRVPVGYIHVKRTQQTVAKKNGISTSSDIRSPLTGQVTGADKNGRESDLENIMLVALGMDAVLKELNGPRADDMKAKQEMLSDISKQGYVRFNDLTYDVGNKATLNTVDTYFIGMGIRTDLATKGLMLNSTLKKET